MDREAPRKGLGERVRHLMPSGVEDSLTGEIRTVDSNSDIRTDRLTDQIRGLRAEMESRTDATAAVMDRLARDVAEIRDVVRALHDDVPRLRRWLYAVRETGEYEQVWADREPLVSVRIATYNRARKLADVCLASVLSQSYERLEVVVVGDGCTDDTADVLGRIGDPRVRFVNLPHRSVYPPDSEHYWYVLGAPAMNLAARLSTGTWIAPIDDDDSWTPDHVEVLLDTALSRRAELAYGRLVQRWETTGEVKEIGLYPPECGEFSFHGAIYMKLLGFFEYDTSSWAMREPGDWNLCRRMLEAGVRMGFTESSVGTLNFEFKDFHYDLFGVPRPADTGREEPSS